MNSLSKVMVVLVFLLGIRIGATAGIVWSVSDNLNAAARFSAAETARSTARIQPLLMVANEGNLDLFRSMARSELSASALDLNNANNSDFLDSGNRQLVKFTIESLARNRERLQIGAYADPPNETVETVLARYDR